MLLTLHDIIPTHVLETMRGKTEEETEKDTVLHYTILYSFYPRLYSRQQQKQIPNKVGPTTHLYPNASSNPNLLIDTEMSPDPTRLRFF